MADDDHIIARNRIEELLDDEPRSFVFAAHEADGVNIVHRDRSGGIAAEQMIELIAAQIHYLAENTGAVEPEISYMATRIAVKRRKSQ